MARVGTPRQNRKKRKEYKISRRQKRKSPIRLADHDRSPQPEVRYKSSGTQERSGWRASMAVAKQNRDHCCYLEPHQPHARAHMPFISRSKIEIEWSSNCETNADKGNEASNKLDLSQQANAGER